MWQHARLSKTDIGAKFCQIKQKLTSAPMTRQMHRLLDLTAQSVLLAGEIIFKPMIMVIIGSLQLKSAQTL